MPFGCTVRYRIVPCSTFFCLFLFYFVIKNRTAFVAVPHWRGYCGLLSRAMPSTPYSFLHHHVSLIVFAFPPRLFRPCSWRCARRLQISSGRTYPLRCRDTSGRGVDLISFGQLNVDAVIHFNYKTWKIGQPNVEGLGYCLGGKRLVVGRKFKRTEFVVSASRASLLL